MKVNAYCSRCQNTRPSFTFLEKRADVYVRVVVSDLSRSTNLHSSLSTEQTVQWISAFNNKPLHGLSSCSRDQVE